MIGYLISVAVAAIPTTAALAPVPRNRALGRAMWRLGMQINELPQICAGWVLAATALAAGQGGLGTPAALAGVILAALTLAGTAVIFARGVHAGPAAARALAAGLGSQWRADLPPEAAVRRIRPPWLHALFAPLAVRRRDVLRDADVTYGPADAQNLLDVYRPRSGPLTGPCLVYFHGGGFRGGRKNREARALVYRLASRGWLCVSADYRLARTAAYPAPLIDAKRVVAWLREHAADYGADPSIVVVAGSSAGAHLAAMVALTPAVATLQPGFESVDTGVCAAICLYGFYVSPTWIPRDPAAPSAPIEELHDDAPPMLIAHGTHDSFVPVAAARDFVGRFRSAAPGRPLVYLELPGGQHTFDLNFSLRFSAVIDAAELFTEWVLRRARAPLGEPPR